jgi:AcrR family transcriptional regulator
MVTRNVMSVTWSSFDDCGRHSASVGSAMTVTTDRLKRSVLAQSRSRETRRAIVRAALELWSERGYDQGFDQTTADEIASRAGVAKTTFYFHFARKDEILLEAGWLTAVVVYEDALRAVTSSDTMDEVLAELLEALARRISKSPRSAVRRMLHAQTDVISGRKPDRDRTADPDSYGFQRGFLVILTEAQRRGELPCAVAAQALADMLTSLIMNVIGEWAIGEEDNLHKEFNLAAAVLLAGARNVALAESPSEALSV